MTSYVPPVYAYRPSADQRVATPPRHKVVVIGGGPVGLTAAIDLAQRGVRTVLVDDDNTVSVGSRAICHAKRTLEIWDRLGCAAPMMEKGEGAKALGVGIVFSFIGTLLSSAALMFIAPFLARVALSFGPHEYFAIAIFSLTLIATLSTGSMIKGIFSRKLQKQPTVR